MMPKTKRKRQGTIDGFFKKKTSKLTSLPLQTLTCLQIASYRLSVSSANAVGMHRFD